MGLCRLTALGLLQVREGLGHDGRKLPIAPHPASSILHPEALLQLGCCCKLGATSLWVLGSGRRKVASRTTFVHQKHTGFGVLFWHTTPRWCSV